METIFSENAQDALDEMESTTRAFFLKHIEKISQMPLRRHMKFGLPFNVENVTKQARLVYQLENEKLYIIRCFALHKDYEKWYKSFK